MTLFQLNKNLHNDRLVLSSVSDALSQAISKS